MAEEPLHSFVIDREAAERAFPGIAPRELVLAMLASVHPAPDLEGCLVYLGPAPDDATGTVCVGLRGDGSERLQEALVIAFERSGVAVPRLYEGGPEVREPVALASGGRWSRP